VRGTPTIDLERLRELPREEQQEAVRQLERWRDAVKANPLLAYQPHSRQVLFHQAPQKVRGFVGGNQSGKTTAGGFDTAIQAIDAELVPPWLAPYKRFDGDFYARIEVVDLVQALEGVMLPKLRAIFPKAALWKTEWDKAYNARRRRLQLANGNWIEFLTHDMEVDQHAGGTLHRVWYDEEPPGNKGRMIYEENEQRLLHHDGDTLFTMTPLLGFGGLTYDLLTDKGVPRNDEDVFTVHVHQDDNPYLSDRAKARSRKGKSAEKLAARVEGRFVHFAGVIYPQWDENRHVVPATDPHRDHKTGEVLASVYVGIDPGIDHPTGLVWVTEDAAGRFEVIRSMKVKGATTGQISSLIHATNADLRVQPKGYVIDPSARNRNQQTGRSLQMSFVDHGIVTIPANNDRRAGFDRIRFLLEADMLHVHAGNEQLSDEFKTYRWKPAPNAESVGAEEPIKVNDDILDALRYVIMFRTIPGNEDSEPELNLPGPQIAFRDRIRNLRSRRTGMHPVGTGHFR
jgi:phage terminase large subunit-like protein